MIDIKDPKSESVKLVPSLLGYTLKAISHEDLKHSTHYLSVVNNINVDITKYTYVYGAVPSKMVPCVKYIMLLYKSIMEQNITTDKFKKHDNNTEKDGRRDIKLMKQGKSSKQKNTRNLHYAPLVDGEIETVAYVYWQLSCQDLINWRDDTVRMTTKALLEYACSLIPDKRLRLKIASFTDFQNKNYITSKCLLKIKIEFTCIMNDIRKAYRDTDPAKYKKAIKVWHYFMELCDITSLLMSTHFN